ncbi:PspC domain-containing protein [Hylemonella gracilis]|uniref:Phage shock protein C, PspC n=1 Tax=Hylemonella gracilis ATCC 19624 TaxID=887062 RepID=F3KY48_9BURK|nr:PspC domain-containing protein [Hylemonella gracilis]EGI75301.1 phage shock protein C, PspC [Hylemonella gracilis ATCC 19624]
MSLADELKKLEELRQRGALSEAEFGRAKARLLEVPAVAHAGGVDAINGFRLSSSDRWIAGVCGGLARSTGLASWIWRLILVLLVCFGGFGLLGYLLLWIFVPRD